MTHDHKDGCCGTGADKGKDCCKMTACCKSGWVTGLAVIVAVVSLAYAFTNDGTPRMGAKPKVDTSTLIKGEDTVVAKVNGEAVHKSDVALAIKDLGANVPPENVDQILPAFLDQYINLKLINEAAEKDGTAKDDDVKLAMANSRDQIIRAAYLRKLFEGKIGDDVLKAAYKAKYEDQPMAQEVHARHILVDDQAKANDLIAQLNGGANFEELAKADSKDPSAQRGGDLGYFTQSEMVKEFGDAAFAMRPGQISTAPVKTQFGWHVIKVEDKRQRAKPSYDEAKPALEQEARQALLDAKLKELRAAAKIEIEPSAQPAAAPAPGAAPAAPAPEAAPAPAPAAEPAPAPAATPAP